MSKLTAALSYAASGLPVLPLHFISNGRCSCRDGGSKCKPGKHPFGRFVPNGLKNATTDPELIRQWWTQEPECNVGIRTGEISDIFVLDVDDRDDGSTSLSRLESQHGCLPTTLTQTTGGGRHLIFKAPQKISIKGSQGGIGKGLDVRGDGGYIVVAPSDHESGAVYRLESDTGFDRSKLSDAPQWLIDICRKDQKKPKPDTTSPTTSSSAMAGKIHDGEGREGFILQQAGELRARGLPQASIEEILLALNQTKIDPPLTDDVVLDRARRYGGDVVNNDEWPDPADLVEELLPVVPFNPMLLPAAFREWVTDTADRMQAPIDFLAVEAMVAAGSVVGNKVGVQPKRSDYGWVEVPNLWGGVVGRPSSMKSPVLEAMTAPVSELQKRSMEQYDAQGANRQFEMAKYEADRKAFEQKLKTGSATQSGMPLEPKFAPPKRYMVNDTTFQKLGEILKDNPSGVLIFQDELSGLLESVSSKGQEGARAFYLTGWNGRQSYAFDRIGRGTTVISRLCLSVLGGFQPAKLRQHLGAAVMGGKHDDGMAQRFQLLVYPDQSNDWTYTDRPPQYDMERIESVFARLDTLKPEDTGAGCESGIGIPILKFDNEAQHLFEKMLTNLEHRLRSGDFDPALESHIAKFRKLIPALALLIHLIDVGAGPVSKAALKKAWGWSLYLESHARRVYAVASGIKDQATRSLIKLLELGKLTDGFTTREVYRTGRSGLGRPEDAQEAIDTLVELGWLRTILDPIGSKPGRPSFRYVISPKIQRAAR